MNMSSSGSTASMIGPTVANGPSRPGGTGTSRKTKYSKVSSSAGTTRIRAIVRGSLRSCAAIRRTVATGADRRALMRTP